MVTLRPGLIWRQLFLFVLKKQHSLEALWKVYPTAHQAFSFASSIAGRAWKRGSRGRCLTDEIYRACGTPDWSTTRSLAAFTCPSENLTRDDWSGLKPFSRHLDITFFGGQATIMLVFQQKANGGFPPRILSNILFERRGHDMTLPSLITLIPMEYNDRLPKTEGKGVQEEPVNPEIFPTCQHYIIFIRFRLIASIALMTFGLRIGRPKFQENLLVFGHMTDSPSSKTRSFADDFVVVQIFALLERKRPGHRSETTVAAATVVNSDPISKVFFQGQFAWRLCFGPFCFGLFKMNGMISLGFCSVGIGLLVWLQINLCRRNAGRNGPGIGPLLFRRDQFGDRQRSLGSRTLKANGDVNRVGWIGILPILFLVTLSLEGRTNGVHKPDRLTSFAGLGFCHDIFPTFSQQEFFNGALMPVRWCPIELPAPPSFECVGRRIDANQTNVIWATLTESKAYLLFCRLLHCITVISIVLHFFWTRNPRHRSPLGLADNGRKETSFSADFASLLSQRNRDPHMTDEKTSFGVIQRRPIASGQLSDRTWEKLRPFTDQSGGSIQAIDSSNIFPIVLRRQKSEGDTWGPVAPTSWTTWGGLGTGPSNSLIWEMLTLYLKGKTFLRSRDHQTER